MKSNCREACKFVLIFLTTFLLIAIIWQYGGQVASRVSSLLQKEPNRKGSNETVTNSFSKIFMKNSNLSNNQSINEFNRAKFLILSKTSNDFLLRLPSQHGCGNPDLLFSFSHKKPLNRFGRIVRGHEAAPNTYPWMASLKHFKNNIVSDHFCAGSLIFDIYVLTAAHCVFGLKLDSFVVVFGLHVLNDTADHVSSNTYTVDKVMFHENYNHKDPNYDIALIKLRNRVSLSWSVYPICLPESSLLTSSIVNKFVFVAGWGRSDPEAAYVPNQNRRLQHTVLKVINGDPLCSKHLQTFDYSNLYCAFDPNVTKSSNVCIGDSGGPLMIYRENKYYIYGIVSFVFTFFDSDGKFKCYTQAPSYFTKVPQYIDWLAKMLVE